MLWSLMYLRSFGRLWGLHFRDLYFLVFDDRYDGLDFFLVTHGSMNWCRSINWCWCWCRSISWCWSMDWYGSGDVTCLLGCNCSDAHGS